MTALLERSSDRGQTRARRAKRAGALAVATLATALAPTSAAGAEHAARGTLGPRAHAAVIGGQAAAAGTYPWMAFVLDFRGGEVGQCSGTVVAPNLVLTAAHCAEDVHSGVVDEAAGYRVTTGNVDWAAPESGRQVSDVTRVIVCPCFDRHTLVGDVALLQLSTPTTASAVSLASSPRGQTPATLAGWGKIVPTQEAPIELLQWASTVAQRAAWCELEAPPFSAASEACTIDPPDRRTGVCEGDSGGPLLVAEPATSGGMMQVGVASHAYNGCATTRPSVFTRVDAVSAWIKGWEQALASSPAASEPLPPTLVAAPVLSGIASARGLRIAHGGISFVLSCDSEGGACNGDAEASITVRRQLVARRAGAQTVSTRIVKVRLADVGFGIAPGASIIASAALSGKDQQLLARLGARPRDVTLSGCGITAPNVRVVERTAGAR